VTEPTAAAIWMHVDSLQPWDRNPVIHDDEQVADLEALIAATVWTAPIVARTSDHRVIAGHGRRLAALRAIAADAAWRLADAPAPGMVPVRLVDVDDATATRLTLADNALTKAAPWDDSELADLLRALGDDAVGIGFDADDLAALLDEPVERPAATDDVPEVQVEVHSKPGEVYALGPHRLVCGDSTKPETWAALMGGERADMVWTDPPYGVAYVGKTKDAMTIENDRLDNDGLDVFLGFVLDEMLKSSKPGSAVYVAAPPGPRGVPFAVQLLARGMFRQRLVWVKNCMVLGHSDYHYRHEDIYFGYTPGTAGQGRLGRGGAGWFGGNAQTSVLEFDKPSRSEEHPTMKPVALVARCIENSSKPGWLVAEPFGGSGTTLLACAQTGRVARLIEMDPRYCDVIRRRWTRYADANNIPAGEGALR
jgi:DNA modification methylase